MIITRASAFADAPPPKSQQVAILNAARAAELSARVLMDDLNWAAVYFHRRPISRTRIAMGCLADLQRNLPVPLEKLVDAMTQHLDVSAGDLYPDADDLPSPESVEKGARRTVDDCVEPPVSFFSGAFVPDAFGQLTKKRVVFFRQWQWDFFQRACGCEPHPAETRAEIGHYEQGQALMP